LFDLLADGRRRDSQFVGGFDKALMPRGSLEGADCFQRGQTAAHRDSLIMG